MNLVVLHGDHRQVVGCRTRESLFEGINVAGIEKPKKTGDDPLQ